MDSEPGVFKLGQHGGKRLKGQRNANGTLKRGSNSVDYIIARLERDARARAFLEDKDTITTWLVSSMKFLRDRRDLAKKIAEANVELTKWIQENQAEAQKLLIDELKAETRADFAPDAVAPAWNRIQFTSDVSRALIAKSVQDGKEAGFLKGSTDTSKLVETP